MKLSIYEKMKLILNIGFRSGFSIIRDFKKEGDSCVNQIRFRNRWIKYRPGTADVFWIYSILGNKLLPGIHGCYDVKLRNNPNVIIDGGANIGLFSICMKRRYPNARIAAIEPQNENYELLEYNLSEYADVITIKKGIWSKTTKLYITNPADVDGFRCYETFVDGADVVEAIDVDTILNLIKLDERDSLFVKLDIEGAEENVFDNISGSKWLERADSVMLEIHDFLIPGLTDKIIPYMKSKGFTCRRVSDNYLFER